ncbi:subtilisin-like protease SBT2.4 [Arachis duranensis]|uniref:Subtilisin-like protease SBT2.4 n=1 Tax=Arachis duranensis TaxID=130453 RepID=A0A9C6T6X2_ARADU|nr:subtilisin-like protease SBT2.4 [Arachis duranensis]
MAKGNSVTSMVLPSSLTLLLMMSIFISIFVISITCFHDDEERHIYLVLLEGDGIAFQKGSHSQDSTTIDPNRLISSYLREETEAKHDEILQSALEDGSYKKLHSFKHMFNGFSVHTSRSQATRLRNLAGVKLVQRDNGAKLMTTHTPQFLSLPTGIWTQLGGPAHAGDGVVIGFVDSGINPTHPSFAYDPNLHPFTSNLSSFSSAECQFGPFFPASSCNGKIVSAKFFSAGAQAAVNLNASVDILSPFDAEGHGSHVASIAAGNGGVPVVVNGVFYGKASGMAPRARIAVYKAAYPSGSTLADVVAAMDQAVSDRVDILTVSVGPDEPPPDGTLTFLNMFEVAMLFARKAGVFVVQAAGNKGPYPSTVVSFSPWAMGVGASTTDRTYPAHLLLGNGQVLDGASLSGPGFGNGKVLQKLVLAKDALKKNGTFQHTPEYIEECQHPEAFDPNLVFARIVICTCSYGFYTGTSSFAAIVDTARTLGFSGFIYVANPRYGSYKPQAYPFALPSILISRVDDAKVISQYYEEHTKRDERGNFIESDAMAAIGEGRVASFTERSPVVSLFSSRGPDISNNRKSLADVLKPDVLAPGDQIWAAYSPMSVSNPMLRGHEFAILSGTSMATPHVAGIAALIKQYNPSWTPSMIASAITTTSTKFDNLGENIMAESYPIGTLHSSTPFECGAGIVNPNRANDPGLVLPSEFADYVSFLCSLPGIGQDTILATIGVPCNQSFSDPYDLNLPSVTISSLRGSASMRRTFINVGNKTETYLATVMPPFGTTVDLSPTWFTISPQGTQDLNIRLNVYATMKNFSFGEIVLTGNLNHIVRITLSVLPSLIY